MARFNQLALVLSILLVGSILVLPADSATRLRPALVQVDFSGPEDLRGLLALGLDIIEVRPSEYAKILVSDEEMAQISEAGYSYQILYPDLTAQVQASLGTQLDMGGYHTLDEVYASMDSIHNEHPAITTARDSIGYTIEGRALYAMKISDNPEVDEDEAEVFFNSLTHAREPMGMELLLYFMRYLTDNYGSDARVDSIVNGRELWFVLVVNPDGYYFNEQIAPQGGGFWRKNLRNNGDGTYGVDLNRNFGHKWGYNNLGSSPNPGSEVYRGIGPFSEPETQAMRDFVLDHDFVVTINYHTYGDLLLYTWGYTYFQPPDRSVYEVTSENATSVNQYSWGPGYSTIYETNGDADDWMYGEMFTKKKSISFTPEVGPSFWPPAYMIPTLAAENLEANLLFAEFAGSFSRRSFWSLATEPVFIDTSLIFGDSVILPLILFNHGGLGNIYFKATSTDSPNWMTVEPEETDSLLPDSDSLLLYVRLTSKNLSTAGTYSGTIRILSYNDSTAPYSDTTLIPVLADIFCSGVNQPGDVNASQNLSLADVIHLVNYVFDKDRFATGCFGNDPGNCWTPDPLCRGEVNGISPVGLPDVIHLANFVFDKDRPATGCLGSDPGNCWIPLATGVCCFSAE